MFIRSPLTVLHCSLEIITKIPREYHCSYTIKWATVSVPVESLDFFLLVHPSSFRKRLKSPLKIYAFLLPWQSLHQLFPSFLYIQLLVFTIFLSKTFNYVGHGVIKSCMHWSNPTGIFFFYYFILLFFLQEYVVITYWLLVYCKLGRFILIEGLTFSFPNLAPLFTPSFEIPRLKQVHFLRQHFIVFIGPHHRLFSTTNTNILLWDKTGIFHIFTSYFNVIYCGKLEGHVWVKRSIVDSWKIHNFHVTLLFRDIWDHCWVHKEIF